jgi:hypothetical protein
VVDWRTDSTQIHHETAMAKLSGLVWQAEGHVERLMGQGHGCAGREWSQSDSSVRIPVTSAMG